MKSLLRSVAVLVLVSIALAASGAIYQSLASSADDHQYPPPGRMIDVGGYHLHIDCTGERVADRPTVIFEGGLGAPSLMWARVQPEMSAITRTCSYDRAGYGWSDPGLAPRTASQIVNELHRLLINAGEPPPYVLVGHSLGGLIVRLYSAEYPGEVSGLVLLDPRHEDFFDTMPPEFLRIDEENLQKARQLRVLTPIGITRLAGNVGWLNGFETYLSPLPDDIEAEAWALMVYRGQHWRTAVAEREAIEETYAEVRVTILPTQLPLIVLTAEKGIEAWQTPDIVITDDIRAQWMELQEEQSRLTDMGQWNLVEGSGHYIYFDQPGVVIEAVVSLLP